MRKITNAQLMVFNNAILGDDSLGIRSISSKKLSYAIDLMHKRLKPEISSMIDMQKKVLGENPTEKDVANSKEWRDFLMTEIEINSHIVNEKDLPDSISINQRRVLENICILPISDADMEKT